MIDTSNCVVFTFEASPVTALPPRVLLDTSALPLIAVWLFVLSMVTLLVFVISESWLDLALIRLNECGPVLLILLVS